MLNRFFVTGTDTGVGKTFVSAALLTLAGQMGHKTAALKPVAAGADVMMGYRQNEDALTLMAAINTPMSYQLVNPVCLEAAIAPHIAAREEGVDLSVANLMATVGNLDALGSTFSLVEGAGGWRVPLNRTETLADFARALGCPVIMIVAMRLGCINHALLTAEAIANDGLRLAGWVANSPGESSMLRYRENLETLKSLIRAPLFGEVLYQPDNDFKKAADSLQLPDGLESFSPKR